MSGPINYFYPTFWYNTSTEISMQHIISVIVGVSKREPTHSGWPSTGATDVVIRMIARLLYLIDTCCKSLFLGSTGIYACHNAPTFTHITHRHTHTQTQTHNTHNTHDKLSLSLGVTLWGWGRSSGGQESPRLLLRSSKNKCVMSAYLGSFASMCL